MVSEVYLGIDSDGTYKILDNESQEIGKLEEVRIKKGKLWTLFLNEGCGLDETEIEEIIQIIKELKYLKTSTIGGINETSYIN